MKKMILAIAMAVLMAPVFVSGASAADAVKITAEISSVKVGDVVIKRNQDQKNTINPAFAKTSRKCPPFCVQANIPVPGVTNVGELEVIEWIKAGKGPVIDGRTTEWHVRGTIPTAKNIPFTQTADRLDELGCKKAGGKWDCANAVDVLMFCNGPWCGQSPTAIRAMAREGYPTNKIYYFRNGMQGWEALGLTVVEGEL